MVATKSNHLFVIAIILARLISLHGVGIAFAKPHYNNYDYGYDSWPANNWNNHPRAPRTYGEYAGESVAPETHPNRREIPSPRVNTKKVARCGVEDDHDGLGPLSYKVLKTKWEFYHLTYKISKYPSSRQTLGGRENIHAELRRAFALWEEVTPFTFEPSRGEVHINIRFESGVHQDVRKYGEFDGPGGILAHAFSPTIGMIHFDEDEYWTMGSSEGKNFFQVAAHEIGHTIGLDHSEVLDSLMYPNYLRYIPDFRLHPDDIQGIQKIYGAPRHTVPEVDYEGYTDPYYDYEPEDQLPFIEYEVPEYDYSEDQLENGLESRFAPEDYAMPPQWGRQTYGRTEHLVLMNGRQMMPHYGGQNLYSTRYD
ncbi:unnamed protein product [Orchesella dallaii]|uniref:Peptidase metallopeptidase domain-containing protein n=1 Tax=Orchesella dallaii TaxID=48710 RepID=A0ABP1RZ44_9HEXA